MKPLSCRRRVLRSLPACAALAVLLVGCSSKGAPRDSSPSASSGKPPASVEPTAPPRPALVFRPTSELVRDSAVGAAVDRLAAEKKIESSHIGAAGAPSAVYAKFDAAWDAATDADRTRLLEHESSIVRGYFGQRIARERGDLLAALAPLLGDESAVATQEGCAGGASTVGGVILDALCYSRLEGVAPILLDAARSGGAVATEALTCAASKAPAEASALAKANIARNASEKVVTASFRVLAVSPDATACADARDAATNGTPSVALAAISALALCADDASSAVLLALRSSSNKSVAENATFNALLNPNTTTVERHELGADKSALSMASHRLRAILESATGSAVILPVLDDIIAISPGAFASALATTAESPAATTAMRDVVAKYPPPNDANGWTVHTAALAYLARVRDESSLSHFRAALDDPSVQEIRIALGAIEKLGDGASRAAVERLTHHAQKDISKLAADVLAKLPPS